MRLRSIGIQSVLHYENAALDLGESTPALHILYGPNEAGKSTLLNLILDILFGGTIEEDFRSYYDARSRIGAVLENQTGDGLAIQRKKYYSSMVLSDTADTPENVIAQELNRCLDGYPREKFMLVFGFDHKRLREGGHSLLRSGGQAEVSLFEAGGGIQHLQNLLNQLKTRSGELLEPSFAKRSSKRINKAWRDYLSTEESIRTSSLRSDVWLRQRDELALLRQQIREQEAKRQGKQSEQKKLERIGRVRNLLAGLHNIHAEISALGNVTCLPGDLDQRIPQLMQKHSTVKNVLDRLASEQQRQAELLGKILPDPAALEQEPEISALNEGLQQYEAFHSKDLPALESKLQNHYRAIEEMLKSIAPELPVGSIGQLRIQHVDEIRIPQLAEAVRTARSALQNEQTAYDDLIADQEKLAQELDTLGVRPDISGLKQTIRFIREQGNLEEEISKTADDLAQRQQTLSAQLKRQKLWPGSAEQLGELQIPSDSTVDEYARSWQNLQQKSNDCARDLTKATHKLTDYKNELAQAELGCHIPDEAELQETRAWRSKGWTLVKRAWREGLPETADEVRLFAGNLPLSDAFETAMETADSTADLMRQNSEQSARRAHLQLLQEQTIQELNQLQKNQTLLEEECAQFSRRWNAEWQPCGILPLSPAEMKDWIAGYHKPCLASLDQIASLAHSLSTLAEKKDACLHELYAAATISQCQPPSNLNLRLLLAFCEQHVSSVEETERTYDSCVKLLQENKQKQETKQRSLKEKRQQCADCETKWQELRTRYSNLPQEVEYASIYLSHLKDLFTAVKDWQDTQSEIKNKSETCKFFEQKAAELAAVLHVKIEPSLAQWVRRLRDRLDAAKAAKNEQRVIQTEMERIAEETRGNTLDLAENDQELKMYQLKYGCEDIDSLTRLVDSSLTLKELKQKYEVQQQSVIQVGDGLSLEALEKEVAESVNPDALPAQLDQLAEETQTLSQLLDESKQRLALLERDFSQLDGSNDDAAANAQKAEQYLAEVDCLWNEYLRVDLAQRLLERTIYDFREQNQYSVIRRASTFFRRLTLGRYKELIVDHDGDTPYLEAIHTDNIKRRVHQMSDGTRDQLFFALRLAFVEQHLEKSAVRLPLIMDDILVNFDDQRTAAALEILHELAGKTQILYFTHHRSVVDTARALAADSSVRIHDLANFAG